MKNIYVITIPRIIVMLICTVLLFSCENEADPTASKSTGNLELDKFFQSKVYADFSTNFNVDINSFQFDKMETTAFESKGLNVFSIPVVKNGVKLGEIAVCSKNGGTTFKVLYEDWSQIDPKSGGIIKVFTSNKFFIADWTAVKSDGKFSMKISATGFKITTRMKSNVTETGETWAECTARVYKAAKDACDASPTCKLACDLADAAAGSCTGSMMAAAAAACAIYG